MLFRTCSLNLVSQNGNYLQKWKRVQGCVTMYAQEQSLFSMSHFFWQPVHIHSIESTADWIHFAFCNLVFIFLFLCCFCLLRDYECMLPISRWNAVHYNIALCESQNCSRSETIPLLQIKFLSSSILIFIWDLMWVKYHPVLFLLIMAGSYFRVRFLLGSSSHRLNRAWRWLGKRADTKKSTDFPLVGNLADPSFIHFGGCCVDPVENIAKKGIYWNKASKNSVLYRK